MIFKTFKELGIWWFGLNISMFKPSNKTTKANLSKTQISQMIQNNRVIGWKGYKHEVCR